MHGPELKAVWVFVLREITWSVKGAPSVLLQSFWTTSIYRIWYFKRSAFITIFSDICTAHVHLRRNGYFWTCGVNLDTNMVGYVTNLATKFQHPTPIRSWFMTYNVSHWLPLKMHLQPLRMRRITLLVSMGSNPWPRFAYSLYNFYGATTMIKGRLLSSVPNAKALDGIISCMWPCNLDLWPFDLEQL